MTPDQMYLRALDRFRTRIAVMERNLDGASLATHEEFEDLCLIIALLERVTKNATQPQAALQTIANGHFEGSDVLIARANGQLPTKSFVPYRATSSSLTAHSTYAIIDVEVSDPAQHCAAEDRATVARYGGKVLVSHAGLSLITSDWHPKRVVVQRWANSESFQRWYRTECESSILEALGVTITNIVLIEGNS